MDSPFPSTFHAPSTWNAAQAAPQRNWSPKSANLNSSLENASSKSANQFSLEKEDFLVNVNKTTQLYNKKENGVVANNYILTFHNTQDKTLIFDIKLKDEKNYKIKRFESFSLEANKKIKKVLIIETTQNYVKQKLRKRSLYKPSLKHTTLCIFQGPCIRKVFYNFYAYGQ